ncbi:hypothetical protein OH77DRAFT_1421148 [Trametes cingulata]|nr:hypothetical protein OH77DRAFT_1421148 [Trametes cingulata]
MWSCRRSSWLELRTRYFWYSSPTLRLHRLPNVADPVRLETYHCVGGTSDSAELLLGYVATHMHGFVFSCIQLKGESDTHSMLSWLVRMDLSVINSSVRKRYLVRRVQWSGGLECGSSLVLWNLILPYTLTVAYNPLYHARLHPSSYSAVFLGFPLSIDAFHHRRIS